MTQKPEADEPRRFRAALIEALKESKDAQLKDIAKKLIAAALEGDMPAIRDIRDILDGKPTTLAELPVHIARIERIIVDPQDQDRAGVPPAAGAGAL
jgi:hypothetical protein